jgi:hypothetical protein
MHFSFLVVTFLSLHGHRAESNSFMRLRRVP